MHFQGDNAPLKFYFKKSARAKLRNCRAFDIIVNTRPLFIIRCIVAFKMWPKFSIDTTDRGDQYSVGRASGIPEQTLLGEYPNPEQKCKDSEYQPKMKTYPALVKS